MQLRDRSSGIVVRCSGERSQAANRAHAWERLAARLEALPPSRRGWPEPPSRGKG